MKYFLPLFLFSLSLFSQQNKLVYGNFVVDNQVYQYKCEKDKSLYKFSVSSLQPKNAFEGFKVSQVDSIITKLTELKADSTLKGKEETINNLETYFKSIKNILTQKESWTKDNTTNDSIDKWIEEIKLSDKNAVALSEAYRMFLTRNNNYNESTEKITNDLKLIQFRTNFRSLIPQIIDTINLNDNLNDIADEVFYSIKAKLDFKDDEPITAYLILKKKHVDIDFIIKKWARVKIKNEKGIEKKRIRKKIDIVKTVRCKVEKVTVEFDEGTIKNIFIDVLPELKEYSDIYDKTTIRFRNNMPISVSSKFDPDKFNRQEIYISNSNELLSINNKTIDINCEAHILLSNIVDFNIVAENDREDFSPANCVVQLSEISPVIELKKEKRSRILTAMAFTDVVGLNQNNQNGLVQMEIKRRMNFNTRKITGFFGMRIKKGASYTGWLNYLTPVFSLNKIETNNKYLNLRKSDIDTTASFSDSINHFKVNQLDVYQYRIFNIQGNLNIFNWNLPNWKLSLHANYFVNYGSTLVADSFAIDNRQVINTVGQNTNRIGTFMHGPDVFFDYKPENRLGATFGASYGFQTILSDYYSPNTKYKSGILKLYAIGFLKTNDDSKLFFRFAYNQISGSKGNNFYQVQLGYLIDLFTAGK